MISWDKHSEKWGFGDNDPGLCSACSQHWATSMLVLSLSWTTPRHHPLVGAQKLPAGACSSVVPMTPALCSFAHWCAHSFKLHPCLLLCCSFWMSSYPVFRLRPPGPACIPPELETPWSFWHFDIQWCRVVLDMFFGFAFSSEFIVSNCLQGQDRGPGQSLALYNPLAQFSQPGEAETLLSSSWEHGFEYHSSSEPCPVFPVVP